MDKLKNLMRFIELIKDFDDPMETRVVKSQSEIDAAISEMKDRGKRLAASSNAGLPDGLIRLTFLAEDAFQKTNPDDPRYPSVDL